MESLFLEFPGEKEPKSFYNNYTKQYVSFGVKKSLLYVFYVSYSYFLLTFRQKKDILRKIQYSYVYHLSRKRDSLMNKIYKWDQLENDHIVMVKMTYPFLNKPFNIHWHTEFEIIHVLDGKICVYANRECLWLEEGDCLLLFPGCSHDIGMNPIESAVQIIQFTLSEHFLVGLGKNSFMNAFLFAGYTGSSIRILRKSDRYSAQTIFLCDEIFRTVQADEYFSYGIVYGAIQMLLTYFTSDTREQLRNWELDEKFDLAKFCTYIDNHPLADITLGRVAAHMGYSSKYFSRKFKQMTGIAFRDFLDQIRMQEARRLLGEGKSATEVAMILGYSCVQNFSRSFKRIHQLTVKEMICDKK